MNYISVFHQRKRKKLKREEMREKEGKICSPAFYGIDSELDFIQIVFFHMLEHFFVVFAHSCLCMSIPNSTESERWHVAQWTTQLFFKKSKVLVENRSKILGFNHFLITDSNSTFFQLLRSLNISDLVKSKLGIRGKISKIYILSIISSSRL